MGVTPDTTCPLSFKEQFQFKSSLMQLVKVCTTIALGAGPMLHILNCETSKDMSSKLKSVYEQKSEASINFLQQQFFGFNKDPYDSVVTHVSKLEKLVKQLKDLGE
uniref:Uncharacterized protein n=1 Tax=Megaselia scalaris TaxID=36166 RepID=T1GII0_MEGSC